jgi:hypothetical protein
MALTVGENTYADLAEAEAYIAEQGLDPLTDENLLVKATKALDRLYGNRYIGTKTLSTQSLYWPRFVTSQYAYQSNAFGDLVDWTSTDIPLEVKEATIELAVAMSSDYNPYVAREPGLTQKSERVEGAVATSYTFAGPFYERDAVLTKIDLILAPVLGSARGSAVTTLARGA